jgi:acetylornithine deacetylase/succinyl-diaminopimelate desuccinylase-like protein
LPTALYCQQLWQPGKVAGCHREGEHCTYPHRTIDTTVMASQIVMTLQTIVSRNIDPLESVVVSVTSLSTESEAWNVIPERVEIRSTVRTFDPGMRKMAEERLKTIVTSTVQAFGGSVDLEWKPGYPSMVNAERETDMILFADGSQWAEDQPNLITGLKGLVAAQITVTGAKGDQHSGQQGVGIANPIHGLSHLIASMKGLDGKIKVASFYDDVIDLTVVDRAAIILVPFDEAQYITDMGVPDVFGEEGYSTRERLWARPTFELNGIWGGWQGDGIKTVLPAQAFAKITCRLVANQKPNAIFALLKAHIEAHCPPCLRVQVERLAGSADPFLVPSGHNSSTAAAEVLTEVNGKKPYITRMGGSIPVMTMLLNELGIHATVFAFSNERRKPARPERILPAFKLQNRTDGILPAAGTLGIGDSKQSVVGRSVKCWRSGQTPFHVLIAFL